MTDRIRDLNPIVIGGVGGSGTRVVAKLLMELGFYMGRDLNSSNDNLWFTLLFRRPRWFATCSKTQVFRGLEIFENAMTGQLELRRDGLPFIARALCEALSSKPGLWVRDSEWKNNSALLRLSLIRPAVTILCLGGVDHLGGPRWGWKEPNSHIYIRHLNEYFGHLKYIHVMRHGLDMAYSNNLQQLYNWGSLLGVEMPDSPDLIPRAALDYWIKSNERAISLGRHLMGDRFMPVRLDDLCAEPRREVQRLLDFIEPEEVRTDVEELFDMFNTPPSVGRYKDQDLSVFSSAQIKAVQRLGFVV